VNNSLENRPLTELWDIVRETKYAKGRWYYPFLWFSAVCSVILFISLSILFLPVLFLYVITLIYIDNRRVIK